MLFPAGIVLAAALSASAVEPGPAASLVYDQMKPGQAFEIAAGDTLLRGQFVDPATGECLVATASADRQFGAPHPMWLLGATQGSQAGSGGLTLMLMHQIKVGMKMEVGDGDLAREHRSFTAPVTSIVLLPGGGG